MPIKYHNPERYFDKFAPKYDETVQKPDYNYTGVEHVFNVVGGFLSENPRATVLDVGCGTGLIGQKLKDEFPDITLLGVDVSPKMRVAARKKGIYSELKKVNLERDRFPQRTDSIDLVVSSATYDYVKRLKPSFGEVARVLKPTGKLCITTYAGEDAENEFLRRTHEADADVAGYIHDDIKHYEHSLADVIGLLDELGIDAEHVETFDAFCNFEGGDRGTQYHLFDGLRR